MIYKLVRLSDKKFPYLIMDLKRDYPRVSFPSEVLPEVDYSEYGAALVEIEDPPTGINMSENSIVLSQPVYNELLGHFTAEWVITPYSEEDLIKINNLGWDLFYNEMINDSKMIEYERVANSIHPSIVSKKDLAYNMINSSGTKTFKTVFNIFCSIAQVAFEDRETWANKAKEFFLPRDFVEIIRGID